MRKKCTFSAKKPGDALGSVDISDQTAGQGLRSEPETCLNPIPGRVMGNPHGSFRRNRFLQIQEVIEMSTEPNASFHLKLQVGLAQA